MLAIVAGCRFFGGIAGFLELSIPNSSVKLAILHPR